jgi:hypothetical protein
MEELEVPTEHLHEEIQEKAENQRGKWILYLALSTAFMAVLAAVAGLLAGHHANEALIEQVKASDQWNFYQSKNLKEEIAANTDQVLHAVYEGRSTATALPQPPDHSKDIARYEKDKADIMEKAKENEKLSRYHLEKHVPLATAVTAFQIAIAVSAIAVLTRRKILWFAGLFLTAIGIFFLILGILP